MKPLGGAKLFRITLGNMGTRKTRHIMPRPGKSPMTPAVIFQYALLLVFLFAGTGFSQPDHPNKQISLSLLYSSNVLGEYQPCG
jgi:hypothetical protein